MISIKYQNIYNQFIQNYKKIHIDPYHEISEDEIASIYNELVNSMDITDDYNFYYFVNYIIKRLNGKSDAHTKLDMVSIMPINFKLFDDAVIVNYPEELKGASLKAINGVDIIQILNEMDNILTYGTPGKKRFEIEKGLFNRYTMFSLPSLRNSEELSYEFETLDGHIITKKFDRKINELDGKTFDYDKFLYGNPATYKIIGDILVYRHSSVQSKFEGKIKESIDILEKKDLSHILTIIIDLRGNTGGDSGLNKFIIDFLKNHVDKKLLCLTDYRVFSAGRYALGDLIKLGAVTIGEEISTPINCFGNSNWVLFDKYSFSISGCYFNPFINYFARSKEDFAETKTDELLKPVIFKPDVYIKQSKEDFIKNKDTVLNYALNFGKEKSISKKV